jgi:DNA-binding NtrC family response regulator
MTHKVGKVELANRGTLFLEEIGEMPGDLQVKAPPDSAGRIEKVDATAPVKLDARFVAASHRNLRSHH